MWSESESSPKLEATSADLQPEAELLKAQTCKQKPDACCWKPPSFGVVCYTALHVATAD